MLQDFLVVILTANAILWILLQQLCYEIFYDIGVFKIVCLATWKVNAGIADISHQSISLLIIEWTDAEKHFEDHYSNSPPIDIFTVVPVDYHLRGKVLKSATEGGGRLFSLQEFCKAEIYNFDVAI